MNTTLTEHTTDEIEELRKDYYEEYYPNTRIEKAIFKYLDQDYYAGRDNVFFSVYKKENDWFVNKKDIEEEITKMFGLTLPERIKIGPDKHIEPARNPIPGRVIHNWIVNHQKVYDKEEKKDTRPPSERFTEDLKNWGFDGKEIGPLKEDKMNLCDKLTVNNEKEIRDGMEGMTIPSKDKKKIEELIDKMNNRRKKLGNNLDISNNYLHRIQNILCTFSPEDKENIKEPHPHLHELKEHTNPKAINKFLTDFWPKYRRQVYSDLYNTYHSSAYSESFNRPSNQFENALETIADAVHDGKQLGLLDSSVDWSDIVYYDENDYSTNDLRVLDDNGIPTLNDKLEIMDNTNLDWIHGILLFDVLEDIVEEFRCYCGENGVDPKCEGKCMDEFPPPAIEGTNKPENSGTLKQDYYTLFNFMRELDRAGIPVAEYMRSPLFPNIIKLVDTGSTDYDEEGKQRKKYALIDKIIDDTIDSEKDQDDIDAEEILMDVPERLDEQDSVIPLSKEEKALEIKRVKDEIETNKKVIKKMEDSLVKLKPAPKYGPLSKKKDDKDKPAVIGIGTAYYAEQENPEGDDATTGTTGFKDFKIDTEISQKSKDLEKAAIQGNIDYKKTQNQELKKKLEDLKKPDSRETDSTNVMSQGDGEVDPTKTIKPLKIDKVVKDLPPEEKAKLTEHDDAEDGAERLYKQHAYDNEDYVDNSPFTRKEVIILKALHKNLSRSELQQLSNETPETYGGGSGSKFWNVMKLFGIEYANDVEDDTRTSKYAKWAVDNWTEEGDYGNIENPIKVPLKWYDVERSETGSQIEYKTGETEVLGFDEDDASERADYDFYSWGGEMETNDWGDYESYDSTIDRIDFKRMDEQINPELKYTIDQEYRTDPEMRDALLQSLDDEAEEFTTFSISLEDDTPILDVPPIKIAQKFSDANQYGNIKFDLQGGNGIAYFTDKDLVIKLTADESEYQTANKLVGTDNEYIVKVFESARIKTSHSTAPIFIIVEEALPMTEDMEQTWSECCCGVDSPIHIDYLEEPALVLPPVSSQNKCLPIYDNIVDIQKNFAEYGILWSDIGIDNMGIKNGKLAVVDLGETRGGTSEGKTITLEHINIRPLTSKQIKKQLVLI